MSIFDRFDENLYRRYEPLAIRIANAFARRCKSADRDCLTSAALAAVCEAISRRDESRNFESYVRSLVRCRLRDSLRVQFSRQTRPCHGQRRGRSVYAKNLYADLEYSESLAVLMAEAKDCGACQINSGDWIESIEHSLADHDRTLLRMRLAGHTLLEVARVCGVAESCVCQRWSKLARRIAEMFGRPERGAEVARVF